MTIFSARDDEDHLVIRPDKTNIANPDVAAMYSIRAVQQFEPTEDDDGTVAKLECFATSDRTNSEWVADNYSETNSLDPVDRLNAEATAESWQGLPSGEPSAYGFGRGQGRRQSSGHRPADIAACPTQARCGHRTGQG